MRIGEASLSEEYNENKREQLWVGSLGVTSGGASGEGQGGSNEHPLTRTGSRVSPCSSHRLPITPNSGRGQVAGGVDREDTTSGYFDASVKCGPCTISSGG
jgi:hypothetical protein